MGDSLRINRAAAARPMRLVGLGAPQGSFGWVGVAAVAVVVAVLAVLAVAFRRARESQGTAG